MKKTNSSSRKIPELFIRPLTHLGQPVLRRKAHNVTFRGPKLKHLVAEMMATLADSGGVGIAAFKKNFRAFSDGRWSNCRAGLRWFRGQDFSA